jgi:gentisate 1,2-dioxygenase
MGAPLLWQRIELVVPFDPGYSAEPRQWDWVDVADLPEQPLVMNAGQVADSMEAAAESPRT